MMKCFIRILVEFLVFAFFSSCTLDLSFLKKKSEDIVAEVEDEVLYYDDLKSGLNFKNLNEGDSLLLADSYVKKWISDCLMYNKAKEEVDDLKEIDSLVENYRHSLIIYEYELKLVNEHLTETLSDAQMRIYYKENSSLFTLSEPLLQGMLLVSYSDVPDIQVLESLMQSPSEDNLDLISSVSVKNAAKFDYFSNRWTPLSEIQEISPLLLQEKNLKKNELYTVADSMYTVFLYVQDVKFAGDLQPYEYAQGRIRSILSEQNKNEFLRNYRKNLYESGIQKGQAKRYK